MNSKNTTILLCFLASIVIYMVRMCLSQAMIPMAKIYDWNEIDQGYIFSAFYYGYIAIQVPGGLLNHLIDSQYLVFFGILISSTLNILCIFAAEYTMYALIGLRIIVGLFQGLFWPSCLNILSKYIPEKDNPMAVAIILSGQNLGTALIQGLYPHIAIRCGWKAPFYMIGSLSWIWALVWLKYMPSKTKKHRNTQIPQEYDAITNITQMETNLRLEFWSLFKYKRIWSYLIIMFCFNWAFYSLVSYLPKFLIYILNFSEPTAGNITLLTYFGLYVTILAGGKTVMFLKKFFETKYVRKAILCGGISISGTLIFIMTLIPYREEFKILISILISLGVSINGFSLSAFAPNPMDLAPQSPSIIASLGNVIGTIPGFMASIVAGNILNTGDCKSCFEEPDSCKAAWQTLFQLCLVFQLFGSLVWLTFGSVDPVRKNRLPLSIPSDSSLSNRLTITT